MTQKRVLSTSEFFTELSKQIGKLEEDSKQLERVKKIVKKWYSGPRYPWSANEPLYRILKELGLGKE